MATLILDPFEEERLLAERCAKGADRYDEVWEGIYMMAPMPNDEHQQLVTCLVAIFQEVIGWPGLGQVRSGVNVSDRKVGWKNNYRVPDVAVFLQTCKAENCSAFWYGGPDLAVEIISPGDKSRDKMEFYGRVHVQELLLIDREPWRLELWRLQGDSFQCAGQVEADGDSLKSDVLPFEFALRSGERRPLVYVDHAGKKQWRL